MLRGDGGCEVCKRGVRSPRCKDARGNPSLLIQHRGKNIVIDCGKTFRERAMRLFPAHGVRYVDAVILTHEHADATLGLDDLRLVQRRVFSGDPIAAKKAAIQVFASDAAMKHCRRAFGYLFPREKQSKEQAVKRFVARLDWKEIRPFKPFVVGGDLIITPIPVEHGSDLICMAFCFGPHHARCAYISDVSLIPDETWEYLESFPRHELLILDCLRPSHARYNIPPSKYVHYDLPMAIKTVKRLRPKKARFVGMGHGMPHDETNEMLANHPDLCGVDCALSFDGLVVEIG